MLVSPVSKPVVVFPTAGDDFFVDLCKNWSREIISNDWNRRKLNNKNNNFSFDKVSSYLKGATASVIMTIVIKTLVSGPGSELSTIITRSGLFPSLSVLFDTKLGTAWESSSFKVESIMIFLATVSLPLPALPAGNNEPDAGRGLPVSKARPVSAIRRRQTPPSLKWLKNKNRIYVYLHSRALDPIPE